MPEQFIEKLIRYLERWREMAGFEQNHEGLENLILRDQYFLTCDKALRSTNLPVGERQVKPERYDQSG